MTKGKIDRIYHPWMEWECYRAGFYETLPPAGMTPDDARNEYVRFFSDLSNFDTGIARVLAEWPNSCEQFLTNENINRIAWLGQASICLMWNVPSYFKSGFLLLSYDQQLAANNMSQLSIQGWVNDRLERNHRSACREVRAELGGAWLPGWHS